MTRENRDSRSIARWLMQSRELLLHDERYCVLLNVIREHFPNSINMFIISAGVSQCEDLYSVIVDGEFYIDIEIPRISGNQVVTRITHISEYLKNKVLSNRTRYIINIALKLSSIVNKGEM